VGEAAPSERLPESLAALPHTDTVYLTLGTAFHDTPGVFETALAGLRDLPLNIVVTTGPDSDPARLGRSARNVVIERYIPQALLLPQCRLVISHGGAGTMFGALGHGLPQLLLPQGADQFWNAAACQRVGVALILPPDEVSPPHCLDISAAVDQRAIVHRGRPAHPSRNQRDARRYRRTRQPAPH
jgi:UDP:flavonoid glycosyltransferase YjiC (YdhE family)